MYSPLVGSRADSPCRVRDSVPEKQKQKKFKNKDSAEKEE